MAVKTHFSRNPTGYQYVQSFYNEPGGVYARDALGNVWYVDSANSNAADVAGNGFSPEAPFKTLNFACSQAVSNNDDVIYLCPSHSETFTTAGACSIGVVGVDIIGLGGGTTSTRPQFQISTSTTAGMVIAGNGTWVENVIFNSNGIGNATLPLSITGTDVTLNNCLFNLSSATAGPTNALTATTANGLWINNCQFLEAGAATTGVTTAAVVLTGGTNIRVTNNQFQVSATTSVGPLQNVTTGVYNLQVVGNTFINQTASSTKVFTAVAGTTGMFANNRCGFLSGSAPITAAGMVWGGGNSSVGAVGAVAGTF